MEQGMPKKNIETTPHSLNVMPDHSFIPAPAADPHFDALKGKYTILEKIGHGSQANVYKAKDTNGNLVAIKCFDLQDAADWKTVELFKREVETLKYLSIEGIPQYIDFIESTPYSFLVESYINTRSLQDYMDAGFHPTPKQVKCILRKTLTILKTLHEQVPPIIHRDIKPGNILIEVADDHDVNVWVVDMGTVTSLRHKSHASTIAGTAGYAAPEQFMGNAIPASDIYALGMTIVHLLSGVAPWNMEMKGLCVQYEKYLPPNLPQNIKSLLEDMLRPDPDARIQTAEEAIKCLKAKKKNKKAKKHSKPYVPTKYDDDIDTYFKQEKDEMIEVYDSDLDTTYTYSSADDSHLKYKANNKFIFGICGSISMILAGSLMVFLAPGFSFSAFCASLVVIFIGSLLSGFEIGCLIILLIITVICVFLSSALMGSGLLVAAAGIALFSYLLKHQDDIEFNDIEFKD